MLTIWGGHVWRQNNHPTRGRKFIGMKGMPDIIGYNLNGTAIWCEVKTEGDRLSQDQIDFMNRAAANGCKVYLCTVDDGGFPVVNAWEDHRGLTLK